MKKLIMLGCLSYMIIAFGHIAVGSVMEQLVSHYRKDYEAGSQLLTNQFIGFLAGVLISPWLIGKAGRRNAIRLAFSLFAAAEIGYAFEPSWGAMLALGLFAGFGFGMAETCIGSLVVDAPEGNNASALSMLELFFGIGALVLPVAAALLISQGYWQWTFALTAVFCGLCLLLWLFLPLGKAESFPGKSLAPHAPEKRAPGYSRSELPLLALGALFFAVCVGLELSFTNYLPTILGRTAEMTDSAATLSLSLFWAAMAFGRLFVGRVTRRTGFRNYLIGSCFFAAVCLVGFSLFNESASSLLLIAGMGLSMAGLFAIGLIYMNEAFPGRSDKTTSILIACGGLGGALMPKLSGWMLDRYAPAVTIWQFAGWAALLLAVLSFIIRQKGVRGRTIAAANAEVGA